MIKAGSGWAANWLASNAGAIALVLSGLVLISATAWLAMPSVRAMQARLYRVAMLNELQPVALKNCDLRRFGSRNDGGYLLCDNLSDGIGSAYSYGVGPNDDFGCALSTRYSVPVHQYDCFDPRRPTCKGGTALFHNECVGPRTGRDDKNRAFDTVQNQIARNNDAGKRLIVKMDVEGAEWDSLLVTPDAVLDRIDQMPMELHITPQDQGVTGLHLQVVRKLKRMFYVVNLNFNNHACDGRMEPLPAWAFQVLLVNKRLGELDRSVPVPAPRSPLNAPDNPGGRDCQLPSVSR